MHSSKAVSTDIVYFLVRVVVSVTNTRLRGEELSSVSEWPMIAV
jgi:hypothetical protein